MKLHQRLDIYMASKGRAGICDPINCVGTNFPVADIPNIIIVLQCIYRAHELNYEYNDDLWEYQGSSVGMFVPEGFVVLYSRVAMDEYLLDISKDAEGMVKFPVN